jgi:hypothetical protein
MITFDEESTQLLLKMPITETRTMQVDDRNFTLIDTEEFLRILELAGLKHRRA